LRGSVRVYCDSEPVGDFTAPDTIHVPAHHSHAFQTLAPDCMLACIHNADHADPDGEPPIVAENNLVMED
jgi:hypothetical protein